MSRKIKPHRTFKAIRQLPLTISYQQVERWVLQATSPPKETYKRSWLSRIKAWLFR